VGPLMM
jgi:very-short-patch-repair endonuclease